MILNNTIGASSSWALNKMLVLKLGLNDAFVVAFLVDMHNEAERGRELTPDGYFKASIQEIEQSTGVTERIQREALKRLKKESLIFLSNRGNPQTRHIKVNFNALMAVFNGSAQQTSQTQQNVSINTDKTEVLKPTKCKDYYITSNTYNTNTSNTNKDNTYVSELRSDDRVFLMKDLSKEGLDEISAITLAFWKLFRKNMEEMGISNFNQYDKTPLHKWKSHIDKMIRIDKVSIDELRIVYQWLSDTKFNNAKFWRTVIRSTDKLRAKYEDIQIAMYKDADALITIQKRDEERNKRPKMVI